MRRAALPLALACTMASSCGTTTVATNRPDARIYVNGEMVGRGEAEIRQRGAPGRTMIEIRTPEGQRTRREIKRRFTSTTFIFGIFTYGIGLLTAWEYPDVVFVNVAEARPTDSWGDGSSWDRPPQGWRAPARPSAPPTPDRRPGDQSAPPAAAAPTTAAPVESIADPAPAPEPSERDPWTETPPRSTRPAASPRPAR